MRAGGFSLCLLLFIIALCRAKDADKNNYETRSWMQDLKDHLYDRSLLELTIPGTHDSGMLEINMTRKNSSSFSLTPRIYLLCLFRAFKDIYVSLTLYGYNRFIIV